MWRILQHDEPDDFVVATGESISIRDFLDIVFGYLDLDWNQYVDIDPRFYRPAEVDYLLGDATKVRDVLGWEPRTDIRGLAKMMVDHDLDVESRRARAES